MPRVAARLLAVALGVVAGLVAGELTFRALLFSDSGVFARAGAELRDPRLFASSQVGDLYWRLRHVWNDVARDEAPGYDPRFGWRTARFEGEPLTHVNARLLRGRRPVLMFGDSFTRCRTAAVDCFQGLVQELPIGEQSGLLNFGVGGHGFGQIELVAQAGIESQRLALEADPTAPEPVVVIAVYIEDDLDRAAMGVRSWAKPHYRVDGDALVLEPLSGPSTQAVIDAEGLGVRSWLLRFAAYGRGLLPSLAERLRAEHRARVRAITAGLLDQLEATLDPLGWEHVVVILPGEPALRRKTWDYQEALFEELLAERGMRHVNARVDFARDMAENDRDPGDYVGHGEPLVGHYNRLGNSVALSAVLRGIAGEDDGGRPLDDAVLAESARRSLQVLWARLAMAHANRSSSSGPDAPGPVLDGVDPRR